LGLKSGKKKKMRVLATVFFDAFLFVGPWFFCSAFVGPVAKRIDWSSLGARGGRDPSYPDEAERFSKEDLRALRAKLDRQVKLGKFDVPMDDWAYESTTLEAGMVMLGRKENATDVGFAMMQQHFHKSCILLLEHSEEFTLGVQLNRPTRKLIDGWEVWFGGDVGNANVFHAATDGGHLRVECLLKPSAGLALNETDDEVVKIVNELYRTSFAHAKDLVAEGKATKDDFYVFAGYCGWRGGQLRGEIDKGTWTTLQASGQSIIDQLDEMMLRTLKKGDLLDDGVDMWNTLMYRVDKDPSHFERTFDDDMLKVWIETNLGGVVDPKTAAVQERRAVEKMRSISDSDGVVAPGAILAGRAVGGDLLLNRQFLHRSLVLVVAASADLVVLATLNRPTRREVQIDVPGGGARLRRSVAFGGDLPPSGAPGNVLWIKLGPLGPEGLGEPLAAFQEAAQKKLYPPCHVCAPADVAAALRRGHCAIDDVLAVCGVSVWPTDEFTRLLGTGAFTPVDHDKTPWDDVFHLHNKDLAAAKDHHQDDNGIDVYKKTLLLNGLDPEHPTPRDPDHEPNVDSAKTTALADHALNTFSSFY